MARTPWQVQLVLIAAIWGASFLFIKVALEDLPPVWVAFGRNLLGATALLVLLAAQGGRLPRGREVWRHLLVAALILNAIPFVLFSYGETRAPSVLAGIDNATTPLMTLLVILVAYPEERPARQRILGLVLGFFGVFVVLGPWDGVGGDALVGHLCFLGAALCYGIAFPYTRRHLAGRADSATSLMAAQVLLGAALLAPVLPLSGAPALGSLEPGTIGAMLALGTLGTGVAYVMNVNVVRAAGAATASTVTYVVPVFSTLLGVLVLGEGLSWHEPVGAAVVLAGVALGARTGR